MSIKNETEDDSNEEFEGDANDDFDESEGSDDESLDASDPGGGADDESAGEWDESAYRVFREIIFPEPCLSVCPVPSFDPVNQSKSPYTVTSLAGSQTTNPNDGRLYLFRCNLKDRLKAKKSSDASQDNDEDQDEESDSEDESEASDNEDISGPTSKKSKLEIKAKNNYLRTLGLKHYGSCNRVRCSNVVPETSTHFAASWSDQGTIHIHDLTQSLQKLSVQSSYKSNDYSYQPLFSHTCNPKKPVEGFGLGWSEVNPASPRLAAGDCKGRLIVFQPDQSSFKEVVSFQQIQASIEDIVWSPKESTVFATATTDGSLRVWDTRAPSSGKTGAMIMLHNAHESDVNVMAWSPKEPFIVSGGDDFQIKVWDLRQLGKMKPGSQDNDSNRVKPVARYGYHKAPITSLAWNPSPDNFTQFAASSEDHSISIWDLSLEKDSIKSSIVEESDENGKNEDDESIPAQLLFLHEGQREVKEVTWHPGLENLVISTAAQSLHLFLPDNL